MLTRTPHAAGSRCSRTHGLSWVLTLKGPGTSSRLSEAGRKEYAECDRAPYDALPRCVEHTLPAQIRALIEFSRFVKSDFRQLPRE